MIDLKNKIVLPVWFETEESFQKQKIGLEDELSINDYEIRLCKIYSITSIEPCFDDILGNCSIVTSGCREFTCNIPFDNIEEVIQDQLNGFK